jgi:predicted dehydrogenase
MNTSVPDLNLDYLPRMPLRRDWRIGCIGAGFTMRDCHLVAYRQAGFNPVAIASRTHAHAKEVGELREIPTIHASIDDLLADPEVEVLDIAVPPDVQPEIIKRAVRNRRIRGILAQKPLAMSVALAKECVALCRKAGIVLAVNQNMRFDQSVRALKDILNRGWLGEPVLATIEMRAIPRWREWSEGLRSLSTFILSVHHLDTFRYWLGTPDRVLASTRSDPRTKFAHTDGINLYILEYDSGARAAAWDDVWTGPVREGALGDIGIRWRFEGTDGMARGTIGWPSYPSRTPSTLDFTTKRFPDYWFQPRWPEVWFPDAFAGTMAQLLVALETGDEPEISGRDNVETIALCTAVETAAQKGRVTAVEDFLK